MLVDELKTLMATSFSFYLKTANYHWNIEGDDFISYHPWLGDVYGNVYGTIDRLAEYIRTLQAYAPASLTRFSELSRIVDQIEVVQPMVLFEQLLGDNQIIIDLLNATFDTATKERQQGIANYMAERLDYHNKLAWMIRSTLKPGTED
jgi:starvation-inducible DNA-binding protein